MKTDSLCINTCTTFKRKTLHPIYEISAIMNLFREGSSSKNAEQETEVRVS